MKNSTTTYLCLLAAIMTWHSYNSWNIIIFFVSLIVYAYKWNIYFCFFVPKLFLCFLFYFVPQYINKIFVYFFNFFLWVSVCLFYAIFIWFFRTENPWLLTNAKNLCPKFFCKKILFCFVYKTFIVFYKFCCQAIFFGIILATVLFVALIAFDFTFSRSCA